MRVIGRSRLAALPGGVARAARVGMVLGVVLFGCSVLLLLSALLWPLGGVGSLPEVALPSVPAAPGPVVEPPGGLVVSLSDEHVFSVLRRPLSERPGVAVAGVDGGVSEGVGGGDGGGRAGPVAVSEPAESGGAVIEVGDPEAARPDIRASFEGVRLFGLFGEGEARGAVLGYVHSERANDPRYVEEGGRFVVPGSRPRGGEAAEGLEWELTAVDGARDRVLISHDGQTFAIALFGEEADRSPLEVSGEAVGSGAGGAAASGDGEEEGREQVADDGTVVVRRSAREIEERLREAGEDASIEELFRLMDLGGAAGGGGDEADGEEGAGGSGSGGDGGGG